MPYQVINLECPGCGGGISTSQRRCDYCNRPIVITSFSDIQSFSPLDLNRYLSQNSSALANNSGNDALNMSQAMCKLKLKLYDDAFPLFKVAQNSFTNSEPFFYAAVCLLKGKKAFVTPRADIDKSLEYINAALMIEPRGIYYYFLAYLKQDYFERKYLNIKPNWQETLQTATDAGVSEADIEQLFSVLNVPQPAWL